MLHLLYLQTTWNIFIARWHVVRFYLFLFSSLSFSISIISNTLYHSHVLLLVLSPQIKFFNWFLEFKRLRYQTNKTSEMHYFSNVFPLLFLKICKKVVLSFCTLLRHSSKRKQCHLKEIKFLKSIYHTLICITHISGILSLCVSKV